MLPLEIKLSEQMMTLIINGDQCSNENIDWQSNVFSKVYSNHENGDSKML